MPIITQSLSKDTADLYRGYNQQEVGLGLINPNIYATKEYGQKKVKNLVIGGVSRIVYAGFEVDPQPLILVMGYEPRYNTVISINLHYISPTARRNALKFVLDSNIARIRSQQPILVDYYGLKRAVPPTRGAVRRYKVVGIAPVRGGTIPLVEWPTIIPEISGFENHWRVNA